MSPAKRRVIVSLSCFFVEGTSWGVSSSGVFSAVSLTICEVVPQAVRNVVKKETGKHAFHTTCKEPIETNYGLYFDGGTYTRYNKLLGRLW